MINRPDPTRTTGDSGLRYLPLLGLAVVVAAIAWGLTTRGSSEPAADSNPADSNPLGVGTDVEWCQRELAILGVDSPAPHAIVDCLDAIDAYRPQGVSGYSETEDTDARRSVRSLWQATWTDDLTDWAEGR